MKTLLGITLVLFAVACTTSETHSDDQLAAKVGDKVLLKRDIPEILPTNVTTEDSVSITRKYIQNWIKKELLLQKAEENLSGPMLSDIEKKLDETRASLFIFNYEQNMIQQRMDTVISDTEIEEYYNRFPDRFELKKNIIQALYIKVPASAPNFDDVRRWYASDEDEDLNQLESYCYQFANKYDDFGENWIYFGDLLSKIPLEITDEERFLRANSTIEASDSLFMYFIKIRDYRLKSTIAPLEFVADQIWSIIFNERKIAFIKELENNLYDDARLRNEFTIY